MYPRESSGGSGPIGFSGGFRRIIQDAPNEFGMRLEWVRGFDWGWTGGVATGFPVRQIRNASPELSTRARSAERWVLAWWVLIVTMSVRGVTWT